MVGTAPREMTRASAMIAAGLSRALALAVAAEQLLEQVALGLRLALERPQLHVLVVGRHRELLRASRSRVSDLDARQPSLASFSKDRVSRSASLRICASRPAICAESSFMRGWPGQQRAAR